MMRPMEKFRAFPFRQQSSEILCRCPASTWPHLFMRWCTCPFEALCAHVPTQGVIYDLGCGHGLLLKWLDAVMPQGPQFIGVDVDPSKVLFAQQFNGSARVAYKVGDIVTDLQCQGAGGIILNDVLHLVPDEAQERLLQMCHKGLAPEGVLLIKEIDKAPRWKYYWSYAQEWVVNDLFRLTQGKNISYRSQQDLLEILRRSGFQVEIIPAHQGYPYPHVIYCCRKG